MAAKQNGPVYSIDKLFTDKELTLTYNTAAVAAHNHILRHRGGDGADSGDGSESGESGSADDAESAPAMERQPSHATRSTRGAASAVDARALGFEAVSDVELPGNLDKLHSADAPKMPTMAPSQYLKPPTRSQDHNTPSSLPADAAGSDLQLMSYFKGFDQRYRSGGALGLNPGLKKALESAAWPRADGRDAGYGGYRQDPEDIRKELGLPAGGENVGGEKLLGAGLGGVAMSRQSSLGGVAMSRQGTNGSGRGKGRKTLG